MNLNPKPKPTSLLNFRQSGVVRLLQHTQCLHSTICLTASLLALPVGYHFNEFE